MKKEKASQIKVKDYEVSIVKHNERDYISLTDMLKAKDGDFFISDWLRNRNTVEFLGIWESLNNPNFNYGEFAIIRSQAGLSSYKISVKEWAEKTNAIGIISKTGRYGGTYAHSDIAFLISEGLSPKQRLTILKDNATQQLKTLMERGYPHSILSPNIEKEISSDFDRNLRGILSVPPKIS